MDGYNLVSSQPMNGVKAVRVAAPKTHLELAAMTAITALYADIEGRNLYECIAQFEHLRDFIEVILKTLNE